jgi:hypothetical protein
MDILSRLLMELQQKIEALETRMQKCVQTSVQNLQALAIMQDNKDQYNQGTFAWYDFEVNCDDWYMDSCHFGDENHFHILFDDSTPPHVDHILESK